MEVLETEDFISISARQGFPIKEVIVDAEVLPYFLAITMLLVVPVVNGILIRKTRSFREILFHGVTELLSVKGIGHWRRFPFEEIREFRIRRYRFKRDIFLYRFDLVLSSGKRVELIRDVHDEQALLSLGKKAKALVRKPVTVNT